MRVEKRSATNERKILTGMILDQQVLSRIVSQWKTGMFRTSWCNIVGQWCIDYFQKYEKPPGRSIEALYSSWAESSHDKSAANLVGEFLENLSSEYETSGELNSQYIVDLAGSHFNSVRMEQLSEAIQADLAMGRADKALERINGWNKVELGVGAGIDVLNDMEAIRRAFEQKSEPLLDFPGALGEFFGNTLERDGFIGFVGMDKIGKSYWLAEIAYRSLLFRRRVAFFECGDLSEEQVMQRLQCRIARQPLFPGTVPYPKEIWRDKGALTASIETKEKVFGVPLSWRKAYKCSQQLATKKLRADDTRWKLSCHPNSTISMNGIKSILTGWEREGWTPDVVVIDYADILASDFPRMEARHQINETWKQMRALSQSLHCLVVTATQTDTEGYARRVLTRRNFSDDKRKNAHVTGMVGLNQTPEEKELDIVRLNWVVRRNGAWNETRCVHVARCLPLANPAVVSCW